MGRVMWKNEPNTFEDMLKTLPTNFKIDCKSHIRKINFAYNNTMHETTGFFYLIFFCFVVMDVYQ